MNLLVSEYVLNIYSDCLWSLSCRENINKGWCRIDNFLISKTKKKTVLTFVVNRLNFLYLFQELFVPNVLTLVLLRVFPKHIFLRRGFCNSPWIINTEGHITLNLLPVYRYGHPLSIDTKISTYH